MLHRRYYYCLVTVAFLAALSLSLSHTSLTWTSHLPSSFTAGADTYCAVDDIVHGEWVQGPPLHTLDDMRQKFHHAYNVRYRCDPREPRTLSEKEGYWPPQVKLDRILSVAEPSFRPRGAECRYRESDWLGTVVRLLRMPVGLTLIGDSLTQQHLGTFENLLHSLGGPIKVHSYKEWNRTIQLDLDHADTADILYLAGVSVDRARFPLVTYWRTLHLGEQHDLDEAFDGAPQFNLDALKFPDWMGLLSRRLEEAYARPTVVRSDVRQEPNVLIVDSGPHWTTKELGRDITEQQVRTGFEKMVDITEKRLRRLKYPMSLYWRTVSPGHIDCDQSPQVDNARQNISSPTDEHKKVYNYHWFSWMNSYLVSKFQYHRPRGAFDFMSRDVHPKGDGDAFNPPFRLLDIWPMSLKRPEAHMNPPGDCLHWCETGVTNEWQRLFWHMIMDESRNTDYDELEGR